MTTQTQSSIEGLIACFELQTRLFHNVTDGISDEHRHERLNNQTNHAAWLTGHLVSTRYMLLGLTGQQAQEPFPDHFAMGKGLEPVDYPTMDALKKDWAEVSQKLMDGLNALRPDQLDAASPIQVPMATGTLRSTIGFFAHHEAYHIGQLGILRRALGYAAMEYK